MGIPCDRGRWDTERPWIEAERARPSRTVSCMVVNGNPARSGVMGDQGTNERDSVLVVANGAIEGDGRSRDHGSKETSENDRILSCVVANGNLVESSVMRDRGTIVRGRPSEAERETSCLLGNGNPVL